MTFKTQWYITHAFVIETVIYFVAIFNENMMNLPHPNVISHTDENIETDDERIKAVIRFVAPFNYNHTDDDSMTYTCAALFNVLKTNIFDQGNTVRCGNVITFRTWLRQLI